MFAISNKIRSQSFTKTGNEQHKSHISLCLSLLLFIQVELLMRSN